MFGKIKCIQCGAILEAQNALKNSGSIFCSKKCSTDYNQDKKDEGCCC